MFRPKNSFLLKLLTMTRTYKLTPMSAPVRVIPPSKTELKISLQSKHEVLLQGEKEFRLRQSIVYS